LPPLHPHQDKDEWLRRLAAKARRTTPTGWLVHSVALVQGVLIFIETNNMTGAMRTARPSRRVAYFTSNTRNDAAVAARAGTCRTDCRNALKGGA
jgi:hypothetical protein